ncbi:hypothetical protein N7478_013024 [Penicillium angulare]|uniref:uncharacterized protein n=1 Tax=Penicillium angulare TaxID=116970 RepID=UPI0025422120|nr:uncharacterized protein N7478_013024 [Penicillium angulare]KAJ5256920.1 hypothetical protein N7478_013024 [Penicillium angulare]
MIPLSESIQKHALSSCIYHIKVFTRHDLLSQPFLPELRTVINASYRDHDINPIGKVGYRIQSDTQVADEIGTSGFTAIAFASNEIVGTASVKDWVSEADGISWKPESYFAGKGPEDASSMEILGSYINDSTLDVADCTGDFELFLVAVKSGEKYRKTGIAEKLIKACEKELRGRFTSSLSQPAENAHLRIMLKVVREINGKYWLKKGFQIVGECYCPPFTWDLENAFILWAMRKDLPIDVPASQDYKGIA